MGSRPTLNEILQSTSESLFPSEMGNRRVEVNSRDLDGDTPLHVMVWRKDRYAVQVLLAAGADPNAVGDMGETPLHVAVRLELLPIVELLITSGAAVDIRSEFGDTPAEIASAKGGNLRKLLKAKRKV